MASFSFEPMLEAEYKRLYSTMTYSDSVKKSALAVVNRAIKNKQEYDAVQSRTGVPWYFVAIIHSLECSGDFKKHLHNGDSLKAKTVRVPAGRPKNGNPPFSWGDSATDAVMFKGFDRIPKDKWTVERMLHLLEAYNGYGYRQYHSMATPYLWSGTNHYKSGKYVADGKFDPSAVSKQIGAAVLLKEFLSLP